MKQASIAGQIGTFLGLSWPYFATSVTKRYAPWEATAPYHRDSNVPRNLAAELPLAHLIPECTSAHSHGEQRIRRCCGCRPGGNFRSRSAPIPLRQAHKLQGDLGHTDLQEDLEFHSSSKLMHYLPSMLADRHLRLREHAQFSRQQDPARRRRLPPHPRGRLVLAQTLPLDPLLLRASLRRRHGLGPQPLQSHPLPARKLPRCPRGQPRPLRPRMDRDDRRRHPVPHGDHQPVPRTPGERALCVRL
jgi:hypothetical protein